MKKILLPVEETKRSLKALNYVKKHYTADEAEIVILMTDESLGYSVDHEAEAAALRKLDEKLALVAENLSGYKLTPVSAVGKAGIRITRAARETGADLIVMTKSSKEDMISSVGSTTEYVLNNAPCDVIIVSEQSGARNVYRGLVYKTAKGTVTLRGQLGYKHSECLLPSVNQDCIYHISVTVGKVRFFHTAYDPDTRNWDLPPKPGQEVTLDIAAGESRDILVKADSTDGKADRIRIVNRDMKREAVFSFRITAATEEKKAAVEEAAPVRRKDPMETRATMEVPRIDEPAIPEDFEAPEVPTFVSQAKAEFDALEIAVAEAEKPVSEKPSVEEAAAAEKVIVEPVTEEAAPAEYMTDGIRWDEPGSSDPDPIFSIEIN